MREEREEKHKNIVQKILTFSHFDDKKSGDLQTKRFFLNPKRSGHPVSRPDDRFMNFAPFQVSLNRSGIPE